MHKKVRRLFYASYALSSILPILLVIFIVFQCILPQLNENQIYGLRNTISYGLLAVLMISLLGFSLMFRRIKSMENLTSEIKSMSAKIIKEWADSSEEDELKALRDTFDTLSSELEEKARQISTYSRKLIDLNIKLSKQAMTDELTGLYNKRYFEIRLKEEINRALRYNHDLALVMIDIDFFKEHNDLCGHPSGDRLLRDFALLVQSNIRKSDIPFRLGGDEFAVILPESNTDMAKIAARNLADAVSNHNFEGREKQSPAKITISCGVSSYAGDMNQFVEEADGYLYRAKTSGRNTIAGPASE